jgi:integrase
MSATGQNKVKADGRGGDQGGGVKRPFTTEQLQLIRANLSAMGERMQLALLETAVSTCLRSSDLLALRWETLSGPVEAFDVKQKKTGDIVTVELSTKARVALDYWLEHGGAESARVFPVGREQYARIVKEWARMAHCNPKHYSTHSLRRTQPSHLYKMTGNLKAASVLLGHRSLAHTTKYLGVETQDALKLRRENEA